MNRADILNEAKECVTKDRAATHGNAENSFEEVAFLWNFWLKGRFKFGEGITSLDVAEMLGDLKKVRRKNNPSYIDNYVDGCGYTSLAGEIATKSKRQDVDLPPLVVNLKKGETYGSQ